jgi:MerR family transcriptional regulator, light-induced transcriptional regulator
MGSIDKEAAAQLYLQRTELTQAIVERIYRNRQPEWGRFGPEGREKSWSDAGFHLSYLIESVGASCPALFDDYIGWAASLFRGLNLPSDALFQTMQGTSDAITEALPASLAAVIHPYLASAIQQLGHSPSDPPLFVRPEMPLGELAKQYLDAVLSGDRQSASHRVLAAAQQGVSVKDIYLHVFQNCQREVGRLWQLSQISVAGEHFATAVTQLIMSQLYDTISTTPRNCRKMLAASVGGEPHELGIRMVADFFEMDGWDTYYLGADTPLAAFVSAVNVQRPDVVCASVTMAYHIPQARAIIAALQSAQSDKHARILVGGYVFTTACDLWRDVGADGYAPDAQQAVLVARRLLGF